MTVVKPITNLTEGIRPVKTNEPAASAESTVKEIGVERLLKAEPVQLCVDTMQAIVQGSRNSTTQKVMDLFGGAVGFSRLPELAWKDEFHAGGTGYIDGVRPTDMEKPMMRGIDYANRPFLAVKVVREVPSDDDSAAAQEEAFVLFQRYTDDLNTWTNGCHHGPDFVVTRLDDDGLSRLKTLIVKGSSTAAPTVGISEGEVVDVQVPIKLASA